VRERDAGRWHYLTGTLAAKIQRDNLIGRRQGRPWRRVADQCRRHAWNCGVEDIDEINSLLRDYGKQITTHTHTHTQRGTDVENVGKNAKNVGKNKTV